LIEKISFSLGEKIAFFRKQRGLSQDTLANMLGKSRSAIAAYENNNVEVTVNVLYEISNALNLNIQDFLTGNNYGGSYEEDLKVRIKHLETELELVKKELLYKNKLLEFYEGKEADYEKREADYDNRLKQLQRVYDEIVKKLT
jgi:transcriptional regulator with XRE-family HTH domain